MLPIEIDAHSLTALKADNTSVAYIDVRSPMEVAQSRAGNSLNIPLNQLQQSVSKISKTVDRLIVICAHGQRSMMATQWLRQNGFENAQSLSGGMASFRRFEEMAA